MKEVIFPELMPQFRNDLNAKFYEYGCIPSIETPAGRNIYKLIAYIALQYAIAALQYPDISFLLAPLNLMA